jgi:hypothetical protein
MAPYGDGRDYSPRSRENFIENQHVHDLSIVDSALGVLLIICIIVAIL